MVRTGEPRARAPAGVRRRREPRPGKAPGQRLGVEPARRIALDAGGEDFGLPGAGGRFEALQRGEHLRQGVGSFQPRVVGQMLPGEQEAQEVAGGDRLDLGAQPPDGVVVDAREQAAVAPLLVIDAGQKPPAQDRAFALQGHQRTADRLRLEAERGGESGLRHRAETFEPAAQDLDQRLVRRRGGLASRCGDARRAFGIRP